MLNTDAFIAIVSLCATCLSLGVTIGISVGRIKK